MSKRLGVMWIVLVLAAAGAIACGEDDGGDTAEGDSASGDCPTETVITESGLEYEEIECGDGDEAGRGDSVEVHYTGMFEDGEEFDSSVGGDPLPFTVGAGDVIAGFEEGVIGMKEGGMRTVTIPPELGYGETGSGPIPPNSTLVFEIELVTVADG